MNPKLLTLQYLIKCLQSKKAKNNNSLSEKGKNNKNLQKLNKNKINNNTDEKNLIFRKK